MPEKPRERVYVETTVISYPTGRPSRDLLIAAHQQITSDWWSTRRAAFECYVSQSVLEESAGGDKDAAARRLAALGGIPLLDITNAAVELAEGLVAAEAVPKSAAEDALHIAVAAVHGVDYLLTWNCRHLANAALRHRIDDVCADFGYEAPVICTPEELMGE